VEDIKIRRLGWAGHIVRMEEERIPKKGLNGNFYTTRPVGRPRTRWADVVDRDALQLVGIRGWKRRAENRDKWRHLTREATGLRGCSAIYGWMDGWTEPALPTAVQTSNSNKISNVNWELLSLAMTSINKYCINPVCHTKYCTA
jgi:hypothetical protein